MIFSKVAGGFFCTVMAGGEIPILSGMVYFSERALCLKLGHTKEKNAQAHLLHVHRLFSRL